MNPILHKLGFAADDRVVIVHADDIGMCQATLPAYADLLEAGLLSSAAVMVPCPWFPETARFCRAHPEVDMGVHLTLTCEWTTYRWRPISTRDESSGLMDDEGYFPRTTAEIMARGNANAVATEMRAQVQRAANAGIDITHIDSHMGSVFRNTFLEPYVQLAREAGIPAFFPNPYDERIVARGLSPETTQAGKEIARRLEQQGAPLVDDLRGLPLDQPGDQVPIAKHLFNTLTPGLTVLLLHPAVDTPELRAIASDWQSRVANYEALTNRELCDHVRNSDIHVIGYRVLRDLLRT